MADVEGSPFGADWQYTLYFYDEKNPSFPKENKQDDLTKFKEYIEDGNIQDVLAYKNPLFPFQKTDSLIYHMFLVIKTTKSWWSIEKNGKGLILQCRKNEFDVRKKRGGDERKPDPIEQLKKGRGQHSIRELITWLYDKKELDRKYNVLKDNCQHFGSRVYEYLTGIDAFEFFEMACAPPK